MKLLVVVVVVPVRRGYFSISRERDRLARRGIEYGGEEICLIEGPRSVILLNKYD